MVSERALATALLGLVVAGCGQADPAPRPAAKPPGACSRVPAREVERALARRPLRTREEDTVDLASCSYRGRGVAVRVTVDSASQAARRYFNSLTERQQFYGDRPKLRPRDVKGVGEDDALGGVAAYWVPSTGRLAAYGHERIVKVDLGVRGLSDAASRRAAARIGRIAFDRTRRSHD
jgi:hypothetical protein